MTLVFRRRWPDHDPILRDWRFRRRMGMLDERDQPAALDMKADEDGCLHGQRIRDRKLAEARAASPKGERVSARAGAPGLDVELMTRAYRAAINADGPLNWDTDEVAAQRLAAAYAEGEPE